MKTEKNKIDTLETAISAAKTAGQAVLRLYHKKITIKGGGKNTPITQADIDSEKIIRKSLAGFGYPILSEGTADDKKRLKAEYVWIVDPLDGTSDFVDKTGEFSIMIALCHKKAPVMGVVYRPDNDTLWYAEKGKGAWRLKNGRRIRLGVSAKKNFSDMKTLISRHHLLEKEVAFIKKTRVRKKTHGSAGLKMALIAEGKAEIYLNTSDKTSEWDTAAGKIVLEEAGGKMTDLFGGRISYNRNKPKHLKGFAVSNGKIHEKIIDILKKL